MMKIFMFLAILINDVSASEMKCLKTLNIMGKQLVVMQDQRISQKLILAMKSHDPENNPESLPIFKKDPLKHIVLRLLAKDGKELSRLELDKSFAEIGEKKVNKDGKKIIVVTQNFGIGMGSYNGPVTKILRIENNKISWENVLDLQSKTEVPIALLRSLKSAWNFTSRNRLGEIDILKVSSRPDEEMKKSGYRTTFSRYHFLQNKWILKEVSRDLLWEAEDGSTQLGLTLPNINNFPTMENVVK